MKKKVLSIACALVLCLTLFAGCSSASMYKLSYYDEMDPDRGYNENLFYENDMEAACADPTVIYIDDETDEENYGWFYMYPTSDSDFGCHGFSAYRSKDMKSWQYVGPIFEPEVESWAHNSCWAPECIYDKDTGKYYLFFSAEDYNNPDGKLFENNEDKNFYRSKEAEVKALTEKAADTAAAIEILYEKIEELTEVYQNLNPGDIAPNGERYTQENITDGRNAINNLNRDEENEDIKKADAEALVLNLYTININIMSNSMGFSLGVAVSDSPAGPFVQYTNVPGEPGYDADNRTLTVDLPFLSNEDMWYWL